MQWIVFLLVVTAGGVCADEPAAEAPEAKTPSWLAAWNYPHTVEPIVWSSTSTVHTAQFATTDAFAKVLLFYNDKVALDKKMVTPDGKSHLHLRLDAGLIAGEGVAEARPVAEVARAFGTDPRSLTFEQHSRPWYADREGPEKGRPVDIRVFTHGTPEYVVTLVVTRAAAEKHTHVVLSYVRR